MVTVVDNTGKRSESHIQTLNDVPVGQLFRGRVHFSTPTYGGYKDGIFRKIRPTWAEKGVSFDCLVISESGTPNVYTRGVAPVVTGTGAAFYVNCTKVENYEPLNGVLTITKP